MAFGYCRCLRLSACASVHQCVNPALVRTITSDPFTKLGSGVKKTWLNFIWFYGIIGFNLQGQMWARVTKFGPLNLDQRCITANDYLDCFTVLTISQSPSSARTYIPRPLHGPDCFTVSNLCTNTDLGGRWYFGVNVALVVISRHRNGTDRFSWNLSSWKARIRFEHTVNAMAVDVTVRNGVNDPWRPMLPKIHDTL